MLRLAVVAVLAAWLAGAQDPERFATIDVLVDAGAAELSAWQIELRDPSGRTTLVGVEGGEHEAYAEPPYHDPAALATSRVVLAAFQIDGPLPSGRTRVARLHVAIEGEADPELALRLIVAADGTGAPVDAEVEVEVR